MTTTTTKTNGQPTSATERRAKASGCDIIKTKEWMPIFLGHGRDAGFPVHAKVKLHLGNSHNYIRLCEDDESLFAEELSPRFCFMLGNALIAAAMEADPTVGTAEEVDFDYFNTPAAKDDDE